MTDMTAAENAGYDIALALLAVPDGELGQKLDDLMDGVIGGLAVNPPATVTCIHAALYLLAAATRDVRGPIRLEDFDLIRERITLAFHERELMTKEN